MISRRDLLAALSLLAVAPPGALAQAPAKIWRVGFLSQGRLEFAESDHIYGPFTQGMRELGYIAGKNVVIEWRSADGNLARLPELAAELMRINVDLIVTVATPAALAAQKATTTIPIVMLNLADPVGAGLVKSLARPGGNSTGISMMGADLAPKLLEMIRAMVRGLTRVALLFNPANPTQVLVLKNVRDAAPKLGVRIQAVGASSPGEIASGFARLTRQNTDGIIVLQDPLFLQQRQQIIELVAKQRLPSIALNSEFVGAGGLMSYGPNVAENYRRAAIYIDKIFKGAKPGVLPVEQPTKFELAINLKTAKALGIKVPHSILIQATKVIE